MLWKCLPQLKHAGLGLVFVFAISGCSRSQDDKAHVKLTLPATTLNASKIQSSVSAQSNGNWGQIDPTAIADIGCWAVFVAGTANDGKKCSVGQGANFRTFAFGEQYGLFPSGATIQFETTSGTKKFIVLGARKGSAACEGLGAGGDITSSNYSQPLVLGEATQTLKGGDETVNINVALNAANLDPQRIGNCSFFPGKSVAGFRLEGPVQQSTGNNFTASIQGGVCLRYVLQLRSSDNNGGIVNEQLREFTYSHSALTSPWNGTNPLELYTDASCTQLVTSSNAIQVQPGDDEAEFFIKAQMSTGTGTATLTLADKSATLSSSNLMITANNTVSGTVAVGFFDDNLAVPPGLCEDIDYYVTKNGYYTTGTPSLAVKTLAHSATVTVSGGDGRGLKDLCSTATGAATLALSSKAFGTFAFSNTAAWNIKDVLITDGASDLLVNIQKRADKLAFGGIPNTPVFASDCIPLSVTPQDAAGNSLTLTGNDDSGTSTPMRILASFGAKGLASGSYVQFSTDAACTTAVSGKTSIMNGSSPLSLYLRPSIADESVQLQAFGWPFVPSSDNNANFPTLNPAWDPGLLGSNLVSWLRPLPQAATTPSNSIPGFVQDSSNYFWGWDSLILPAPAPTPLHFTGVSPSSSYASVVNTNGIPSLKFGSGGLNHVHSGGTGLNDFSVTLLVKRGSQLYNSTVANYLQIYTSTTERYFTIAEDNNGGGSAQARIYMESGNVTGSGCGTKSNQIATPLMSDPTTQSTFDGKWAAITLMRAGNAMTVWINGNKVLTADSTTWTAGTGQMEPTDYIYVGTGGDASCSYPAFTGEMAEVIVTSSALSNAQHDQIYQYLKTRYPTANLP